MVPLRRPIDWQQSSETAVPLVAEAERQDGSPHPALLRSYRRANAQPTSAALLRLAQPAALDGARQLGFSLVAGEPVKATPVP